MDPDRREPAQAVKRRTFLSRLSLALGALAAAVAAVPALGSVLGPILKRTPGVWRPVGPLADFPIGRTTEVRFSTPAPEEWAGIAARMGAWLRRDGPSDFTAFSLDCTHLGCPVRWLAEADLFMCPCHGGVFYHDGTVAAGPPPEALKRYPVRVRNGQVEVWTGVIPIIG